MEFTLETLWVLLAAIVCYLALWCYFDASRQRDGYQTGRGAGDLPPNTWAALVFFFAPIAGPLYLKARDGVVLEANPRTGAPPVFVSRGLNVYGWLGLLLFLGGAGYLISEKEYLFAGLALVMAGVAAFGGRAIVATDRALKVDLPESAAWEQVGFRPLPREEDQAEDDPDELVVNLDRLPPAPPGRRARCAAVLRRAGAAAQISPGGHAADSGRAPLWHRRRAGLPATSRAGFPAAAARRGARGPARPPAATSVRISDILWAASEDDFGDGGNELPSAPGAPRAAPGRPPILPFSSSWAASSPRPVRHRAGRPCRRPRPAVPRAGPAAPTSPAPASPAAAFAAPSSRPLRGGPPARARPPARRNERGRRSAAATPRPANRPSRRCPKS